MGCVGNLGLMWRRGGRCLAAVFLLGVMGESIVCAAVSEAEQSLIANRKHLDNVRLVIRTTAPVPPGGKPYHLLDCYWVLGTSMRLDSYRAGNRDGVVYRGYCKPGEAVFYTNESPSEKGKVVVDVRDKDDSLAAQDVKLLGFGIGTLPETSHTPQLLVVGAQENASRALSTVEQRGVKCTEVKYAARGVQHRMLLDPARGFEPLLIEATCKTLAGEDERNTAEIELQQVTKADKTRLWLPKRVVIRQVVAGKTIRELVEEVEEIELGRVSPEAFTLAALDIPVGYTVVDMRQAASSPVGTWNGAEVESALGVQGKVPEQASPRGRRFITMIVAMVPIALLVAAMILATRRRRLARTLTQAPRPATPPERP